MSRRSGGISAGINLNPDKACNFDCIYCQVDRTIKPAERFVETERLCVELERLLEGLLPDGPLWKELEFSGLDANKRVLRDIAFSGDGEPTTFLNFAEVIEACCTIKDRLHPNARTVLITNATGLERADVRRGLARMDASHGDVWAKLDAGTPEYFKQIDNTDFPFARVVSNITACAREREIVIQSCFMRVNGSGPSDVEIGEFCKRLAEIRDAGGQIRLAQIYTVARRPAYEYVSALPSEEVEGITARVTRETGIPAIAY